MKKIHILSTGFTPQVFTDSAGAIVREGADRIISLHTSGDEKEACRKVKATVKDIEMTFGIHVEELEVPDKSFWSMTRHLVRILNGFSFEDRLFLHLGGGKRHLGLGLIYASFMVDRRITLVPTMEYGFKEGRRFSYEYVPTLKPQKLTISQLMVLRILKEVDGGRLTDVVAEMKQPFGSRAPSIYRHLKNLFSLNMVAFDPISKRYSITTLGEFFLATHCG